MRRELQIVLQALPEMTAAQMPELLGELEVLRATAMMKLSAPVPAPQHDELLDANEASARLGISKVQLYRTAEKFPFSRRIGRKLLFSSLGIDQFINRGKR